MGERGGKDIRESEWEEEKVERQGMKQERKGNRTENEAREDMGRTKREGKGKMEGEIYE